MLVIGGHSRNIGKTSVVAGIIAALPEARWQAIKITQYGHSVCEAEGDACHCAPSDPLHRFALNEQKAPDCTDSGRYLAAGAARAWWLRTAQGNLGHAIPTLRHLLTQATHTIVESNSILRFIRPDLYIPVLDFTVSDIKDSARMFLARADALVIVGGRVGEKSEPLWQGVPERWLHKPKFKALPPCYAGADLIDFVRRTLQGNPDASADDALLR
ncbi:MAG: hypothetical protein SFV51_25330 [Bryobacteraceae bacterium]|nr:hypothetical protein [Bryobacteraceae bacterium]